MRHEPAYVTSARMVAVHAHEGQTDKAGNPYFLAHVADVVRRVEEAGLSYQHVAVAYLHDVVEDTQWTFGDLRAMGFPKKIVEAVDAITHRPYEPRHDYYERVLRNVLAREVKYLDIASNTDPERMALLDEATRERLTKKYDHARKALAI